MDSRTPPRLVRSGPTVPGRVATVEETATAFLDFFRERGHRVLPGESLVRPPQDPVLFTTSGMHPLTPYLVGRPHPLGARLADVQRCLRTTDLDEVGDDNHLTAFAMLGSWSLGDYDSAQSLTWGHELLVDGLGLDPGLLHATVFGGDGQVGEDTGALGVWERLGVPVERTTHENWWSNGPTGPCGPDSEIFVWTGDGPPSGTPTSDPRWWEVWNHVTMRYRRHEDGSLTELARGSVDTGMGLERLVTVLSGVRSVYDSDVFADWRRLLPPQWADGETSWRVVADHLRSAVVLIGDGVRPAAGGQGYVLRRLLRRVLTLLWRVDPARSLESLPLPLVAGTLERFGQPGPDPQTVRSALVAEERRFASLLERGRRVLRQPRFARPLADEDYAYLHDTHGLPRDLVAVLREEAGGRRVEEAE